MLAETARRDYRRDVLTFFGLLVLSYVVWYWGRRLTRAIVGLVAVVEASINRVAKRTGEAPIGADIDEDVLR